MLSYDVVVIGAGSVGNCCALELARRGLSVLVIDRRAAEGQGDNKAAIGGLRATHSDPAKILLCRESLRIFASWHELEGDDIGYKQGGYVFPVFDEDMEQRLRALLPLQRSYQLDIDWVDAARMAELVPGIARAGLRGGTYSPGDAQASSLLAATAFARAARRRGAVYRLRERVQGFELRHGRIDAVLTELGRYPCGEVVLAAGADAAELGPPLGLDIPVTPDTHEAGISAPVAPFLGPLVVDLRPGVEGRTSNFYFGQTREGQIIFCYTPRDPILGTDRTSSSEFLPVLARRMVALVPRLKHLLVRRVWRGCYPMTPDGVPIVDRSPGLSNLFLAVGMCGQGFMLGPGVGLEVASRICDGQSLLPPAAQQSLRFDRPMGRDQESLA